MLRYLFVAIVCIHGLIHLIGFAKAYCLLEVKEMSIIVTKPMGVLWLISALLLFLYASLFALKYTSSYVFGMVAMIFSQVLIFYFWKDARIGTIPNVMILGTCLMTYATLVFNDMVKKETIEIWNESISERNHEWQVSEWENLPSPVKKWLQKSGALDRSKTYNGMIIQRAKMRMSPDQKKWYDASAVQYTLLDKPSFIWQVEMNMFPGVWVMGRDKLVNGKGEMLIQLNSIFKIVNEKGVKINEGTIQRFLGEMVWFPALAISPYVTWRPMNNRSAEATIAYNNTTGSGTFYFDENGDFEKFVAFRFKGNEQGAERKEWILKAEAYTIFEGIRIPSQVKAEWRLETGDWNWLNLTIDKIEYNLETPVFE